MFNKKLIISLILFGIVSFSMLIYFYYIQRNFTQNQREFLIKLDTVDNYNSDITSELLKNALFAYNSQDTISQKYNDMQLAIEELKKAEILTHERYEHLKIDVENIDTKIDELLKDVQDFLMLNASVKNSLVFLSRHVEEALKLPEQDKELYIRAIKTLSFFKNTQRMQDLDYIDKFDYLLVSKSKNSQTQLFVKQFNLHASYLIKKFPDFVVVTKKILNNNISLDIHDIRKDFNYISIYDFEFLDIFALILLVSFVLYFTMMLYLLIKYFRQNRKLLRTSESLEFSLTHDQLTGLYNRHACTQDLEVMHKPIVMLINIDGFKHVNDVYGNRFGNKILTKLTELLTELTESVSDKKLYRLGGDEFAIVFKNQNMQNIFKLANYIETFLAQKKFEIETISFNISVSIACNEIAPYLENADLALKLVKKDISQRVIEYRESFNIKKDWENNIKIINIIKSAIEEDRVVPYFQPIVNLKTLEIEKYEALVRIVLPNGDVLAPVHFLDVASKTQYYYDITKIMVSKTMKAVKKYPQFRFSFNLSMRDILNKDITKILFELFKQNRDAASRMDIELLETEEIIDDKFIYDFITEAHSYGSQILIDDFGTGYSNFSYFSNLDIDVIKIDASIVKEITTNARKLHMLKSIHNFSTGMGMKNVAEFVETQEAVKQLQAVGVEYGQGYYFSKPVPEPLSDNFVINKF